MLNKFLFVALLTITVNNYLFSQSFTGKIIDSETNKPIAFAHVSIEGSSLGTISNVLGEFELNLELPLKRIIITHINFNKKIIEKADLTNTIFLNPNSIILDEVIIDGFAYSLADSIFNSLIKFPETSYGKGFYRQISRHDTIVNEFIEAFYDVSKSINGIDELLVTQARFARKQKDSAEKIKFTNFSYLSVGYSLYGKVNSTTIGRPFAEDFYHEYHFFIINRFKRNDEEIVEIGFEPIHLSSDKIMSYGSFIFNTTKFQILEYNASIEHSLGFDDIQGLGKNKAEITNPKFNWKISYEEGSNTVRYINVNFEYDYILNGKSFPSKVFSNFIVYEEVNKAHKNLRSPDIDLDDFKGFLNAKYKPRFWKDNPIIKLTAEEEAIISTFEKENAFGSYFK